MKSIIFFRLLFLATAFLLGNVVVRAESLTAVRTRMEQRLSAVDTLKDRQAVGENNRGYLEQRGNISSEEERTVADENSDRRVVYSAIAAQEKTDSEVVGRQRANKIALGSKRGVWLQGPDGKWYQKG